MPKHGHGSYGGSTRQVGAGSQFLQPAVARTLRLRVELNVLWGEHAANCRRMFSTHLSAQKQPGILESDWFPDRNLRSVTCPDRRAVVIVVDRPKKWVCCSTSVRWFRAAAID